MQYYFAGKGRTTVFDVTSMTRNFRYSTITRASEFGRNRQEPAMLFPAARQSRIEFGVEKSRADYQKSFRLKIAKQGIGHRLAQSP
jgi:hypothetical protein